MTIVFTTLLFLLAVALSGVLMGLLPIRLPQPLVQIAIGAVLAIPSFGLHVAFKPDVFLLLFIAPLLFIDGWRMPRREFQQFAIPIAGLALGLVLVTVLGVGYFAYWLIPALPLAAAFALGAILSPTDAVSVAAITGNTRIPSRLLHILQGESLMNDASGLVSLQFAVAAAMTGSFSLANASWRFLVIAFGGLAIGWATGWLFAQARHYLNQWRTSDPSAHVALLLLLPFAAYTLAEHLHVSGILSAVAAGMTLNNMDVLKGELTTRMQSRGMWEMLEFVFNGIVFLLLGMQLPSILSHAAEALASINAGGLWKLALYPVAITALLMIIRFGWVWMLLNLVGVYARWTGKAVSPRSSSRVVAVTTLAGVRGSITLAAALSLPLVTASGDPFPGRSFLVLVAAGVILLSLLIGTVGLPPLLRQMKLPDEDPRTREERQARSLSAKAAIEALETLRDDNSRKKGDTGEATLYAEVASQVMAAYQPWLDPDGESDDQQRVRRAFSVERTLRLAALDAERVKLHELRRSGEINDVTLRRVTHDIDLTEAALRRGRRRL